MGRGIVLPLVLLVLMLMSVLALVLLSMSAFDPLISRNLAAAEQARFLAEAGLEWAFNTLRASAEWNAFLAGADPIRGAVLAADAALPARPASEGTYTVRVRNDSMTGDQLVTGLPVDAGGHTGDTNGLVIVTSVGSVAGGSRALQAVVQRIKLPPLPAALAFPGEKALVTVSGSFEIDGNDWNPDGMPGSCAPVFGISVSSVLPAVAPGANEAVVESSLANYPTTRVKGKRQDPTGPAEGPNTIASNAELAPTEVQSFVRSARKADMTLESSAPDGLSFNDVGASCASSWSSATCWGTVDRPKVIRVKGRSDPASAVPMLRISGSTEGHGILIVEDAELWIQGNFRWHGAILVTGSGVALGFLGDGSQTVSGAIVLHDSSAEAAGKGFLTGNATLRYSCQALARAQQAQKLVTMRSWREVAQ
jgi:Tfp pilus assembly protein PilX